MNDLHDDVARRNSCVWTKQKEINKTRIYVIVSTASPLPQANPRRSAAKNEGESLSRVSCIEVLRQRVAAPGGVELSEGRCPPSPEGWARTHARFTRAQNSAGRGRASGTPCWRRGAVRGARAMPRALRNAGDAPQHLPWRWMTSASTARVGARDGPGAPRNAGDAATDCRCDVLAGPARGGRG